eukprot:1393288-Amorphochlora_amoeboformis.AAC.1
MAAKARAVSLRRQPQRFLASIRSFQPKKSWIFTKSYLKRSFYARNWRLTALRRGLSRAHVAEQSKRPLGHIACFTEPSSALTIDPCFTLTQFSRVHIFIAKLHLLILKTRIFKSRNYISANPLCFFWLFAFSFTISLRRSAAFAHRVHPKECPNLGAEASVGQREGITYRSP